jgi:hypothetical protein
VSPFEAKEIEHAGSEARERDLDAPFLRPIEEAVPAQRFALLGNLDPNVVMEYGRHRNVIETLGTIVTRKIGHEEITLV